MDILKASVVASYDGKIRSELWLDAIVVGSFVDPETGRTMPKYELTGYTIRHVADRAITKREQGIHRLYLPDSLSRAGRAQEFLDKDHALKTYTLTTGEKAALRSLSPHGLPLSLQLGWEREIHGPMSPTFEQSIVAENEADANGLTFTVTAPTANNLLVICHGNNDGDANSPSLSAGFTHHQTATPGNFRSSMSMLSKIAAGSEGTSIVVTHTNNEADENSGWFAEISGMKTASYTDGFDNVPDVTADVTSRSAGSITTTQADVLLIAAWGYDMDDLPTGFSYSNSFAQQAFIEGAAGSVDHATRIAVRTVAATDTYTTTMSWTNVAGCGGVLGAFVVDAATAPTVTIPTGYLATNNLGPRTISGISVAAGTNPITLVTCTCTSGKGTMTMTGSGDAVVGGNGTNAINITGGSVTDINNTLATFAFTGLEPTRENVTVAVLATDGTLNDSENMVLFNHRTSLSLVADSYADLVAAIQTMKAVLPQGETSDTITLVATDEDTNTDTQVITILVPSANGRGGYHFILRRRRRR